MRSIAILNPKGGSGKTTTTVNLAAALGERERRVLVVDMDAQGTTTRWFGFTNPGRDITDIFITERPLVELVWPTRVLGVALVPASAWLSGVEKALTWEMKAVQFFHRSVASLPAGQWDFLLVDCPPSLGFLTVNTLLGVEEVLVPVEAHYLALQGVNRVVTVVEALRRHLNPRLRIAGILACRVDTRTSHSRDMVRELQRRFGPLVYQAKIRESVRLAEAASRHQPITLFDSNSKGAQDYRALAREIMAGEKEISPKL